MDIPWEYGLIILSILIVTTIVVVISSTISYPYISDKPYSEVKIPSQPNVQTHSSNSNKKNTWKSDMTVSDVVWYTLIQEGITRIFGVPGAGITNFLARRPEKSESNDLTKTKRTKWINISNENLNAFAAQAYGLASPVEPFGVVTCTSGPGVVTALSAIRNARDEQFPLLVIAGLSMPSDNMVRAQGFDYLKTFKGLDVPVFEIKSSDGAVFVLENAIKSIKSQNPGPAVLAVDPNVWEDVVDHPVNLINSLGKSLPYHDISRLNRKMHRAKRPLLVLGRNASCNIGSLAKICSGWPVATTWKGKGLDKVLCNVDPTGKSVACGTLGTLGSYLAAWASCHADFILIVGDPVATGNEEFFFTRFARPVEPISLDDTASGTNRVSVLIPNTWEHRRTWDGTSVVVYDEEQGLSAWLDQLSSVKISTAWKSRVNVAKKKLVDKKGWPRILSPHSTLEHYLSSLPPFSENCIVATGVGNHWYTAGKYVRIQPGNDCWKQSCKPNHKQEPTSACWITSSYWASIGTGLPFGIGAAIACPDKKVFVIEGDGGFVFSLGALWSMEYIPNLTLIVMIDEEYSAVQQGYFSKGVSETLPRASNNVNVSWIDALNKVKGIHVVDVEQPHELKQIVQKRMNYSSFPMIVLCKLKSERAPVYEMDVQNKIFQEAISTENFDALMSVPGTISNKLAN